MISQRTRDGLAAARRRGIKLGNPRPAQALKVAQTANLARADAYAKSLLPVIQEIRAAHVTTLRKIAQCLNARGFKTPNHKAFKAQSVKNLLARAAPATTKAEADPNKREDEGSRPEPAKPKSAKPKPDRA